MGDLVVTFGFGDRLRGQDADVTTVPRADLEVRTVRVGQGDQLVRTGRPGKPGLADRHRVFLRHRRTSVAEAGLSTAQAAVLAHLRQFFAGHRQARLRVHRLLGGGARRRARPRIRPRSARRRAAARPAGSGDRVLPRQPGRRHLPPRSRPCAKVECSLAHGAGIGCRRRGRCARARSSSVLRRPRSWTHRTGNRGGVRSGHFLGARGGAS